MTTTSYICDKWIPINLDMKDKVTVILQEISNRYKDPDQVRMYMKKTPPIEADGMKMDRWSDGSLGSGFTGICLLMGQLDRLYPEDGWDIVGHQYLERIRMIVEQKGVHDLSLYSGLSGILLAIYSLSRKGTRYQGMLDSLASWFEEAALHSLALCREEWGRGQLQMSQYDAISGFTGIGRIAMLFSDRPTMHTIWNQTIELFQIMCSDRTWNGHPVPGWYITTENQFQENEKKQYPQGNFNLGLSHGIAGPLAFLSLSALNGADSLPLVGDINRLSPFIHHWRVQDTEGVIWPGRVSLEEWVDNRLQPESTQYYRDSWCYGVPGIARSIWLAGQALQNKDWIETGLRAYLDIEKRLYRKGGLSSATLCHGIGGLLHLIQRMYSDTGHEQLGMMRDRLLEEVLDMFDTNSAFGFYDHSLLDGRLAEVDEAGFLNGSAGVALVLASLIGNENPDWDAALLIR
ncbi:MULTISPECIES: lanthionine synthetase C family protein [Paenibacillus]|jgi:lantibiotic modifying enzyme|uniref:lanthionine synthetase C family protein n=1 Tax=Paenibacillus TaxID=44249 RepID=UPI0004257CDA|nr:MULTISPECIES: lanthionine synthetase C family protein [Paenibacillus]UMY54625.1 lanthionine synthetase C family protein [Paenibacillus peoriae]